MTERRFNLADYEMVEDRLARFWKDHPKGRVETYIPYLESLGHYVKAEIYREGEELPAATGLATPDETKKQWAIEDCETSAIGRALANLGYAPKGKRPSREEMTKAQSSGGAPPPSAPKTRTPPEPKEGGEGAAGEVSPLPPNKESEGGPRTGESGSPSLLQQATEVFNTVLKLDQKRAQELKLRLVGSSQLSQLDEETLRAFIAELEEVEWSS